MNERIRPDADLSQIRGEISFGPFSNPQLNRILKVFGKEAFGRSSACMEFESFLQKITFGTGSRSRTCLEIGTFHGITAVVLAQYFERVICVSIDDAKAKTKLLKRDIVAELGINNIEFHDVDTNDQKAQLVEGLEFDFCYMDGDHTNDTPTDFNLVQRCGRILFHEFWPLQPAVWNLVNSLPRDEVTVASVDSFAYWERHRG